MTPTLRMRRRMQVVLQMVMAFVVALLLAQLWLFTVALEAAEAQGSAQSIVVVTLLCSLLACAAVWALIRYFLRSEANSGSTL